MARSRTPRRRHALSFSPAFSYAHDDVDDDATTPLASFPRDMPHARVAEDAKSAMS